MRSTWTDAIDAGDFPALTALFEPTGLLVRPDGAQLKGRTAILAAYAARSADRLKRHRLSNQRVRVDVLTPHGWRIRRRDAWFTLVRESAGAA
ncbi:MAG: nuclear transport factor 2 family protein [Betaproteobacteria bacterium]